MKIKTMMLMILLLVMTGCANPGTPSSEDPGASIQYTAISAEDAKSLLETEGNTILLDVRTEDEYNDGHIPGAIRLEQSEFNQSIDALIPDKETTIIVYCRTGSRSKAASLSLLNMGYVEVYDLGGIQNWPYEIVK